MIDLGFLRYLLFAPAIYGGVKAAKAKSNEEKLTYGSVAAASTIGFLLSAPKEDKQVNTPDIPSSGGTVNTLIVRQLVNQLNTVLNKFEPWTPFMTDRCRVLKQANNLPTADFIALVNLYKNEYGKTLAVDILATNHDGCPVGVPEYGDMVINKINSLSI